VPSRGTPRFAGDAGFAMHLLNPINIDQSSQATAILVSE
jgi:hypothetical protein